MRLAASFMPQSSEQYLEPGWAGRTQPGPRHCGSDAGSLASARSGCFHLSLCFCFCRCRLYLSSFFFSDFFSRRFTCFTFTALFRRAGSRNGDSSVSLIQGRPWSSKAPAQKSWYRSGSSGRSSSESGSGVAVASGGSLTADDATAPSSSRMRPSFCDGCGCCWVGSGLRGRGRDSEGVTGESEEGKYLYDSRARSWH